MSLGFTEIILILVAVLLLFGGKRIPELAKALGRASYEYKKAKDVLKNEAKGIKEALEEGEEAGEKPVAFVAEDNLNNPEN